MASPELRAIDICAGAGGWATAARGLPVRIVAAFDLMEDCMETYKLNHPNVECIQCDVFDYDFRQFAGQVDLVVGGIPCEELSQRRNNKPATSEQLSELDRLIDRCLSIVTIVEAPWFCFEDVIQILKRLPPMISSFTLDSAAFSPQRRKRAYVGNIPRPSLPGNKATLRSILRPGPYRRSLRLRDREPVRSRTFAQKQFYPWMPDEKAGTVVALTGQHDDQVATPCNGTWRNLEWQELAILQGFPADYIFMGSMTRTVEMIAQAIQIDTGRAILKALCKELGRRNL